MSDFGTGVYRSGDGAMKFALDGFEVSAETLVSTLRDRVTEAEKAIDKWHVDYTKMLDRAREAEKGRDTFWDRVVELKGKLTRMERNRYAQLKPAFLKEIAGRSYCVSGQEVESLIGGYVGLRDLLGYLLDVRDGERWDDPELNEKCRNAVDGSTSEEKQTCIGCNVELKDGRCPECGCLYR